MTLGERWVDDLFAGPNTAIISPCGTYRPALSRDCGGERPLVCIGLNPSTADHWKNDRTIDKDILFTKAWGFGRFIKLNAYDYRTKHPKLMFAAQKRGIAISSDENDRVILRVVDEALRRGGRVWVAWGGNITPIRQGELKYNLLSAVELWCIKTNKDRYGTPVHELYQPNNSVLQRWGVP